MTASRNKDVRDLLVWYVDGEVGASSESIVSHLTGLGDLGVTHPYDLHDFRRCELMLSRCPGIRRRFAVMQSASETWARLVDAWPDIVQALDDEDPTWRSEWLPGAPMPRAKALLRGALGEEAADGLAQARAQYRQQSAALAKVDLTSGVLVGPVEKPTLRELAEAMRDAPDAASKKLAEVALLHRLAAGDGDAVILAALDAEAATAGLRPKKAHANRA